MWPAGTDLSEVDVLLDGAGRDEAIHTDVPRLAQAVCSVNSKLNRVSMYTKSPSGNICVSMETSNMNTETGSVLVS